MQDSLGRTAVWAVIVEAPPVILWLDSVAALLGRQARPVRKVALT